MVSDGSLRTSDADRDRVVELLSAAYAEGRLSRDEHTERAALALAAKTFDDLAPLTADLAPWGPVPHPSVAPSKVVPQGAIDEPDRMTAALSEVKRVGRWRIRRQSYANTILGSVHLDLTDATFDAPVVEVNGTHLLGTLFLRVPTGTNVRDETTKVLGSTSIKNIGTPDPSLPTVVLRGTNLLGEIKVRGPRRVPPWKRALT